VTLGYLDPGSGSLIISAVVGGAAAAGVAVKQARSRVTGAFRRKTRPAPAPAPAPAPEATTETPAEAPAPAVAAGDDDA